MSLAGNRLLAWSAMIYHLTPCFVRVRPIWSRIACHLLNLRYVLGLPGIIILFFLLSIFTLVFIPQFSYCQPVQKNEIRAHVIDGVLELKIPVDYKSEAIDEPHIFKWTKNSSEIYVVVADRLVGSVKELIANLKRASASAKHLDQIRTLRISNAKGILIKEKEPSDPDRLMSWGIKIFTDKHELNIDFSAPAKEFKTYSPVFEEVIKSIKIKSS